MGGGGGGGGDCQVRESVKLVNHGYWRSHLVLVGRANVEDRPEEGIRITSIQLTLNIGEC